MKGFFQNPINFNLLFIRYFFNLSFLSIILVQKKLFILFLTKKVKSIKINQKNNSKELMEEIVDRTWVISDDDGEIYAEAEANGASVFVLSNKKRAEWFNATKRAGFFKLSFFFVFTLILFFVRSLVWGFQLWFSLKVFGFIPFS